MAWTETDLQALERAISEGAKVVQYQDRRVEYQSLSDMLRLRSIMRAELGMTTTQSGIGARRYASHTKGLR